MTALTLVNGQPPIVITAWPSNVATAMAGSFVSKVSTATAGAIGINPAGAANSIGPAADNYFVVGGETTFPHSIGNARLPFLAGYDNHIWDNSIANHDTAHHSITGGSSGHATVGGGSAHTNVGGYGTIGGGTDNRILANYGTIGGGNLNAVGADGSTTLTVQAVATNTSITVADATGMVIGQTVYIGSGTTGVSGPDGPLERARIANIAGSVITLDTFQSVSTTAVDGTPTGTALTATHPVGSVVWFTDGSNTAATVGGGFSNTAGGQYSTVAGGRGNTASALYATVPGGFTNTASAQSATAIGERAVAREVGQFTQAAGMYALAGDAQTSVKIVRQTTTDNVIKTFAMLTTVQPNVACIWKASLVAHDTATGDTAAWTIQGAFRCNATTTIVQVGGPPTPVQIAVDAGAAAWTVSALNGTGTFNLRITGENAKTIRWVCRFEATEVI